MTETAQRLQPQAGVIVCHITIMLTLKASPEVKIVHSLWTKL